MCIRKTLWMGRVLVDLVVYMFIIFTVSNNGWRWGMLVLFVRKELWKLMKTRMEIDNKWSWSLQLIFLSLSILLYLLSKNYWFIFFQLFRVFLLSNFGLHGEKSFQTIFFTVSFESYCFFWISCMISELKNLFRQ